MLSLGGGLCGGGAVFKVPAIKHRARGGPNAICALSLGVNPDISRKKTAKDYFEVGLRSAVKSPAFYRAQPTAFWWLLTALGDP